MNFHLQSLENKTNKFKRSITNYIFLPKKKIHGETRSEVHFICILLCNVDLKDKNVGENEVILI